MKRAEYAVRVRVPGFVDRYLGGRCDAGRQTDLAYQCAGESAGQGDHPIMLFTNRGHAERYAAAFRSLYPHATFVAVRAVYGVVGWKEV